MKGVFSSSPASRPGFEEFPSTFFTKSTTPGTSEKSSLEANRLAGSGRDYHSTVRWGALACSPPGNLCAGSSKPLLPFPAALIIVRFRRFFLLFCRILYVKHLAFFGCLFLSDLVRSFL